MVVVILNMQNKNNYYAYQNIPTSPNEEPTKRNLPSVDNVWHVSVVYNSF